MILIFTVFKNSRSHIQDVFSYFIYLDSVNSVFVFCRFIWKTHFDPRAAGELEFFIKFSLFCLINRIGSTKRLMRNMQPTLTVTRPTQEAAPPLPSFLFCCFLPRWPLTSRCMLHKLSFCIYTVNQTALFCLLSRAKENSH